MARIFQTGFEIGVFSHVSGVYGVALDAGINAGTVNLSTNYVRTGAYALSLAAGSSCYVYFDENATSSGTLYIKFYFYLTGLPSSDSGLFDLTLVDGGSTYWYPVYIDSAGKLKSNAVTTSNSVNLNAWNYIDASFTNGGTTSETLTCSLNGGSELTRNGLGGQAGTKLVALRLTATDSVSTRYYDDLVINDSSGSVNNSWVKDARVVLVIPTGDAQDGSWTVASGGNTNLFDAVNNFPVLATSPSAASDGNRIESVDGSGDNATDEARFTCTAYADAGILAGSAINVMPFVLAGEESGTGIKSIKYGLYSSPAGSLNTVSDVTKGNSGAIDAYPTQWFWFVGSVVEQSLVTAGAAPTINLRKTDAGTRSATVGFIGAYVDYTPPRSFPNYNPAAHMAALLAM